MKKIFAYSILFLFSFLFLFSCKTEDDPTNDNPNVYSQELNNTLKSFYTPPPIGTSFEGIFSYSFDQAPLNIYCGILLNLNWYDPTDTHGIYWYFNNGVGDVLTDNNGFVKAFDSGIKIDSTLTGTWTYNAKISLDYVVNPSANKGNLAGQGDKYIVFRAFDPDRPQLKFYGWFRATVSENGRNVTVHSIGYQTLSNTSLRTGEL